MGSNADTERERESRAERYHLSLSSLTHDEITRGARERLSDETEDAALGNGREDEIKRPPTRERERRERGRGEREDISDTSSAAKEGGDEDDQRSSSDGYKEKKREKMASVSVCVCGSYLKGGGDQRGTLFLCSLLDCSAHSRP